jgi:hypothetical protein
MKRPSRERGRHYDVVAAAFCGHDGEADLTAINRRAVRTELVRRMSGFEIQVQR